MSYPRLRYYHEDGWLVASDALAMCFYMQHAHRRIAPAVLRALEVLRERMAPQRLDLFIDYEGQEHSLDEARWSSIREEMLGPAQGVILHLEQRANHLGGFKVDYRGLPLPLPWPWRENDVSVLMVRLPTEYLEEQGPSRVRALALEMAAELPFHSGYLGLALSGGGRTPEAIEFVRTRYLGFHLKCELSLSMRNLVQGIHWLNFLGQPLLGQLGGVAALREQLSLPGLTLQEMSGERVLLTLGEQPEVGDVQAGQTLPLHRALARLLAPYQYHRPAHVGGLSPEQLLAWERRFLD